MCQSKAIVIPLSLIMMFKRRLKESSPLKFLKRIRMTKRSQFIHFRNLKPAWTIKLLKRRLSSKWKEHTCYNRDVKRISRESSCLPVKMSLSIYQSNTKTYLQAASVRWKIIRINKTTQLLLGILLELDQPSFPNILEISSGVVADTPLDTELNTSTLPFQIAKVIYTKWTRC